jgi:NAD(P)-dependent dehydrogenase (short-subunit alcohol dehydrogenase family)
MKFGQRLIDHPTLPVYSCRTATKETDMTQTILITGTSSGYGRATADHFLSAGWNVIATMRRPDPSLFVKSDRLRVLPLDVTNSGSIAHLMVLPGL